MPSEYAVMIKRELEEASVVLREFINEEQNIRNIENAVALICASFKAKGKVFSCGNGGSHCDAMHFAEELTGRFREDRPPYPAICISDSSHITCVSNDYGYEYIFSRYIEGLGKCGDVLLGITTSGNSKNIIKAIEVAKEKNIKVVLLSGNKGGDASGMADIEIRVPYFGYADRIQEIHIKIIHIIIQLIENQMKIKHKKN